MVTAYLALGSNLGDASGNIRRALLALAAIPKVKLILASSVHITKPVDAQGGDFANSACKIETTLHAYALLAALQTIEIDFGRPAPDSPDRAGQGMKPARSLDLDILLYGDAKIESQTLTVPHPRMLSRAFVMLPLAEIKAA
jgi:2-amino-4-hydroxy-6-hydroxymethyldihydropteridine diphosphokinase